MGIKKGILKHLTSPYFMTAGAVYISVVCVVFNVFLRFASHAAGEQFFVSNMLHVATPILFVTYWYFFVEKHVYSWKTIPIWAGYLAGYVLFVEIRGAYTGFYPYEFLDPGKWGVGNVILSCGVVTAIFTGFALLYNHISKKMISRNSINARGSNLA